MSYAGDLTPREAWEKLENNPDAVLVDCRTQAEWSFVGVPDLEVLGKRAIFAEWTTFPEGRRNDDFVAQLRDSGVSDDDLLFLADAQTSGGLLVVGEVPGYPVIGETVAGFGITVR